jgi:hypothetical protein
MRLRFDDLCPGGERAVCVHVAHGAWEARRVAACLDACDVPYAETAGDGPQALAFLVPATAEQRALRVLEYAGLRPEPHQGDGPPIH